MKQYYGTEFIGLPPLNIFLLNTNDSPCSPGSVSVVVGCRMLILFLTVEADW